MAKQAAPTQSGSGTIPKPLAKDQRFSVVGKDAFSGFKMRRVEFKTYEEAKRQALIWKGNKGQAIQIITEEAKPGIVWEQVSNEPI